jgi:S1-C subfamily serine protease
MAFSLRPRVQFALTMLLSSACAAHADQLRITSKPPGATVQINGVEVGTTSLEIKYPGGYFHKTKTAISAHLEHQLVARLSLAGYATKEIVLSEGPMEWSSLNGKNRHQYWLLKSNHFDVAFELITATFTGGVAAHLPAGAANLSPELSLESLAAVAKPAVVQLQSAQKSGSGFFVTETGVIATNAHVARDEGSLTTTLADGQRLEGKVVYIDEDLDIALVKVAGENFPHLALAAADTVHQGETVLAIGNPGGAMQFSMTKGIVSAIGKFKEAGPGTWVQTDAPINPGNSGGPLVNMRGEVVGLNTLKLIKKNTTGIAFALSASDLLDVLHRFYPATAPSQTPTPVTEASSKNEAMSAAPQAPPDGSPSANPSAAATGTVKFTEPRGAEIYVDGQFVGNIPSTLQLTEGNHQITVKDGKSPDWQRSLEVHAGSTVTLRAQFITAQ